MSHEFIAKNGLIINNSHPVNNISNKTTGIAYDENSLMTEKSIRLAIEEYVPDLSFATGNGVVSGMTLSVNINDNTKFDISSGIYYEKDNGFFDFDGITGITAINILTSPVSYIAYEHNNGVIQKTSHFTNEERRIYIILGVVVHSNNVSINTTNQLPDVAINLTSQFNDFLDSLKVFNKDGNIISANGNNMFINKSDGCIFKRGVNSPNMNDPHNKKLPPLVAPSTIRYRLSDSTEYPDTNSISLNYESSVGELSALPSNRFTIQRVAIFPSNLIRIQEGQFLYKNLAEAYNAIHLEKYVYENNISRDGLLRCFLIIGGSTSRLDDINNVLFVEADKFGEMPTNGIGGTTNLQGAYINSTPDPEIETNSINGALTIRNGEVLNSAHLIDFKNNSGTTVAYVTAEGHISATDALENTHAINLSQFSSHTGDTSIHFTKTSINLSDISNTAHTHTISNVTNLQTELNNKTNLTDFYSHTGNTNNPHGTTLDNLTDTTFGTLSDNQIITYSAGTWKNTGISTIGNEYYLQKTNNLSDVSNKVDSLLNLGGKPYHGVVRTDISPLPSHLTANTFTLDTGNIPLQYYYNGQLVTVNTQKSVQLLTGEGVYFISLSGTTGNLIASETFPVFSLTSSVLIASVTWNGTNYGLVNDERHRYDRDIQWHSWAHKTIGARYGEGITLTHNSGTGAAATFSTTSGLIYDEDIDFTIKASSVFPTPNTARIFYQTSATGYSFLNATSTVPFHRGVNNRPNYVRADTFATVEMSSANNRYMNFFVYVTTDLHTPVYIFTETVSTTIAGTNGYSSVANARAVPFPNLSIMGLSAEIKAIYRLIVRADGALQPISLTQDDYRLVSSLPMAAGGVPTTAGSVTYAPQTPFTSTNVQSAISETLTLFPLKTNNLSDVSNTQTSINNLTNASGSTNEFVLTKDTATGNAIFKQFPKRHYPYSFSLPEDIGNTSVYFYPWVKGTSSTDNIRSGNAQGLSYQGACNPIQLHDNGKLISASLSLKGAGVASGTVTYPVIYRAELWNVGWTTEGTKITDLNFEITSGVGIYSVGVTNTKVHLSGLNIAVSLGDLLALKFVNGSGNSEVAQMLNAFVTIEIEEN